MKWIGTQTIYDNVRFIKDVDITGDLNIAASKSFSIGGVDILTDSSGTTTLNNIDALDATTTATFEAAMESNLDTFTQDTVTFTSANADDPAVIIQNTTVDAQAARLQFIKNRGVDGVDGDNCGEIEFWSYDDGTPSTQMYGKIFCEIHDATSGEESGLMDLMVANHDGGSNSGLRLTGGSVDNEVDVEIGRGAASVTDIQGTLSMGGTAAMTNAGLLSVADQSNITGVGTITSGTWNSAGTLTTASQPNITSIGTLTGFISPSLVKLRPITLPVWKNIFNASCGL